MIVTNNTHLDHGIPLGWLEEVAGCMDNDAPFVVQTFEVPWEVDCILHLDVPESEVFYQKRGTRGYTSRCTERPARKVKTVTVLGGKGEVWTAFGGPLAPREPGDSYFTPHLKYGVMGYVVEDEKIQAEYRASVAFWAKAALSQERYLK